MADTLDPGFIAAPYFGDSSYDPIEAVRRAKLTRYQAAYTKKKKLETDMEKGLKDLTFEMKGWDDQQGFDEISKELENLRARYVELGSKGMNIARPNSLAEQKLSKGFQTALLNLKQKHDIWQVEKQRVDEATKIVQQELTKPEEERDIDTQATLEAIKDWKNTKGGVTERSEKVNDLIVGKARPADIGVYFANQFKAFLPGTDKFPTQVAVDKTTGKVTISTWEGVDPKRATEAVNKIVNNIKYAKPNIRNAIDKAYEVDKANTLLSKEEWIKENFLPTSPIKKETRITGGKSGDLNIGYGLPEKDNSGNYPVQPQVRDIYFPTKGEGGASGDKVYAYESVGRIPIGSVFGYKPVSIMGSANNINTITGEKEGIGKAIPAVPVEFNMLPVAAKAMDIIVKDPKNGKEVKESFTAGEKIPEHVLKAMRIENEKDKGEGRAPKYIYGYQPYVTMGLNYKQVKEGSKAPADMQQFQNPYLDLSGRVMSYTETSLVPYNEVKNDLFSAAKENKQDWKPYDDYIQQMVNQLNGSDKINKLFELRDKSVEEVYQTLEK
jgi:hypothetical protein